MVVWRRGVVMPAPIVIATAVSVGGRVVLVLVV